MASSRQPPTINSLPGLVRAFREWASEAEVPLTPNVPGAGETERKLLGALGGIAASVAQGHLHTWPSLPRDWALSGPKPPPWLTEVVGTELGRRVDVLAVLYNACVSAPNRRRLGTVFTPDPVVQHMLSLADDRLTAIPAQVVDPGAGVGAFTIAAARRWPSASIIAVDINVVTLGLLAARIAFEIDAHPDEADTLSKIQLVFGDYLDELKDIYTIEAEGAVVTVGNPPYTRTQELPPSDRRKASRLAGEIIDNGHANLAMLFQAATLAHMRTQDISCMILPGSFSYTRASHGLRQALWEASRRIDVHRWPATERAFIGRSVQAAILAVGPTLANRPPLQLARVELNDDSVKLVESWSISRKMGEPDNWFQSQHITSSHPRDTVPLSSVAIVRRGVATGANKMFFVNDAVAAELPDEVIVAGIPTLRGFEGEVLDDQAHIFWGGLDARRWFLAISPDYPLIGRLADYVESFEKEVRFRHLPSKRRIWYSILPPPVPPLLISPLSKARFKVVNNAADAVPSNNLFGISPIDELDAEGIATWLRSDEGQEELLRVSRRYPGGSYKLEPASLASARIPRNIKLNT